jgi:transcriptional regulator with XRE-family HTH domain
MARRRVPLTLRRRRLARELRRYRLAAGLSLEDAAPHIDKTHATLSRIETGHQGISGALVGVLCDAYGVSDPDKATLVTLARQVTHKGWWHKYRDVLSSETSAYIDFETEASGIKTFECQFIPGLLQTAEYARALIAPAAVATHEEDIDRAVAVRLERQKRFTAEPPFEFVAIVDESALRRPTGGREAMVEQLRHMMELGRRSNVTLQILPLSLGSHPGMVGSFSLIEFPDPEDPDVVYTEGVGGEVYLEDEKDVRRCDVLFDRLRSAALGQEPSEELMAKILERHERGDREGN